MKELTREERVGVNDRWIAKVQRGKGKGACWRWVGAEVPKRNGPRGVIRIGGRKGVTVAAVKVGVILAERLPFLPYLKRKTRRLCDSRLTYCVNPAHNEFEAKKKQKARTKGAGHAKGQG